MKAKPIIFNSDMIRAILREIEAPGTGKTQTRRVIKPSAGLQKAWLKQSTIDQVPDGYLCGVNGELGWQMYHPKAGQRHMGVDVPKTSPLGWIKCPYGQRGNLLWVRETALYWFRTSDSVKDKIAVYKADGYELEDGERWTPSIHTPRWASRLFACRPY